MRIALLFALLCAGSCSRGVRLAEAPAERSSSASTLPNSPKVQPSSPPTPPVSFPSRGAPSPPGWFCQWAECLPETTGAAESASVQAGMKPSPPVEQTSETPFSPSPIQPSHPASSRPPLELGPPCQPWPDDGWPVEAKGLFALVACGVAFLVAWAIGAVWYVLGLPHVRG